MPRGVYVRRPRAAARPRRRYVQRLKLVPRRKFTRPLLMTNPTFTETCSLGQIASGVGGVFSCSMDDIPQLAQYSTLYRQYKINWAKFTIIPDYNSYDGSQAVVLDGTSMPRIAWAVNDTPGIPAPVNEVQLLEDNGARVKAIVTQWSKSCKPMPVQTTGAAANPALMRYKASPWLSFQPVGTANPVHSGISYFISQILSGAGNPRMFNVYVKINFSLRDPQ